MKILKKGITIPKDRVIYICTKCGCIFIPDKSDKPVGVVIWGSRKSVQGYICPNQTCKNIMY